MTNKKDEAAEVKSTVEMTDEQKTLKARAEKLYDILQEEPRVILTSVLKFTEAGIYSEPKLVMAEEVTGKDNESTNEQSEDEGDAGEATSDDKADKGSK